MARAICKDKHRQVKHAQCLYTVAHWAAVSLRQFLKYPRIQLRTESTSIARIYAAGTVTCLVVESTLAHARRIETTSASANK